MGKGVLGLLLAFVLLVVAAAPASAAHAAPWRWKRISPLPRGVGAGTQEEVTLYCPAGYRPVSLEWWAPSGRYGLELQAEYVDYTGNLGHLKVYNHTLDNRYLYTALNCVHGDDIGAITTASGTADRVGSRSGGFVDCPDGWGPLSAGVDWEGYSTERRIDFSSPTEVGWYATGYDPEPNTHLYIEVHCVSQAVLSGAEMVQAQVGGLASQAVEATVNCPAGKRVANAGAFQYPVDGSVDPFSTAHGSTRAVGQNHPPGSPGQFAVVATMPNDSTWLVARAWCVPYSTPVLLVYTHPSGPQNSRTISYSFTAADPAGEALRYKCYLNGYSKIPCQPGPQPNMLSDFWDGSYTLIIEAYNDSNQVDSETYSFTVDTKAPVSTSPVVSFPINTVLSGLDVHTRATWSASDPAPASGVAANELQLSDTGGATWSNVPLPVPTATQKGVNLTRGATDYRFRTRATDGAGNLGGFATSPRFEIRVLQENSPLITLTSGWTTHSVPTADQGAFARTATPGQRATFNAPNSLALAWVSHRGPDGGKANVFLDGVKVAGVDLYRPTVQDRVVVFGTTVTPGPHTVEIRVQATKNPASTGFNVWLDAIVRALQV